MFIDFEGIDGSGKTTLSNAVAARLKKLGYRVAHARENGALQSPAARRIRELTRDSQLLELSPRTEFFLNVARDAQQLAEVIRPALERGQVCISDRYLYSQLALSGSGRGLPVEELESAVQLASQGVWPDLVILVDVDPDLARLRKRLGKVGQPKASDSRKGLVGAGLSVRVREAFVRMARADPDRWLVIENNEQPLWMLEQRIVEAVVARLEGREPQAQALAPRRRPQPPVTAANLEESFERAMDDLETREPKLCAYLLSGIPGATVHRRRLGLMTAHPEMIALGLVGMQDEASWALRDALLGFAPAQVLTSLGTDPSARAMDLRYAFFGAHPAEAVNGLKLQDTPEAWELRERAWAQGEQAAVLGGLSGVDTARAWALREEGARAGLIQPVLKSLQGMAGAPAEALRERFFEEDRLAVLRSTTGLDTPLAQRLRESLADRATKVVMRSLTGVDAGYAWALRERAALHSKEALDSLDGMDTAQAWDLRERFADRWPSTALSSLRPLPFTERARALVERVLSERPGRLPVLRNAYAAWAEGTRAPQPARALPRVTAASVQPQVP